MRRCPGLGELQNAGGHTELGAGGDQACPGGNAGAAGAMESEDDSMDKECSFLGSSSEEEGEEGQEVSESVLSSPPWGHRGWWALPGIHSLLISCVLYIAPLIAALALSAVLLKQLLVFDELAVINCLLHLMQ